MTYPWLEGPVTSTTYGWRLERKDGVTLGFTSHDRDLVIEGLHYRASPGISPSSIVETLGVEATSLDVRGALTSDGLKPEDIEAGLWDGASLTIFMFDWSDPESQHYLLAMGTLGSISWAGHSFEVEFQGPAARLNGAVSTTVSPSCRVKFAGSGCGLNPLRYSIETAVVGTSGARIQLERPIDPTSYVHGEFRWLSGRNCGARQQIVAFEGVDLVLDAEPAFPVFGGERIALLQGCDRTIATCATRFQNAKNFRGEPHVPGNDLLTRYPGG